MDPSIMKLLEDDEDESMHSGADVEAFTAALNRDIGGDASAVPQPPDAEAGTLFQANSSASQQVLGQWQNSGEKENHSQQIQPNEEQQHLHSLEKHSSRIDHFPEDAKDQSQLISDQSEKSSSQFIKKEQPNFPEQKTVVPKQEFTHPSENPQQLMQRLNNQQAPAVNQANNAVRNKVMPSISFHLLIPVLRPQLDKDRQMQLMAAFMRLRNNEVTKADFLRVTRNIVGDQMLRQAVNKVQMQMEAQAARSSQTNRQIQMQTDTSNLPTSQKENKAQSLPTNINVGNAPREMSTIPMQTVNKQPQQLQLQQQQQQQHTQLPHTSFPMYGRGNFHAHNYPRPVGASINPPHTQIGGVQPRNAMNMPKYDAANENKRVHTQITHPGLQHNNPAMWQLSSNKDQKASPFPLEAKKEVDQPSESANDLQLVGPEMGTSQISGPLATQVEQNMQNQMHPQTSSAMPTSLAGVNSKTPQKKTSIGQKKPLEALGTSPPPSSKKQKTSGAFLDQSIEQLNDVTAVSGVNLKEEEEQLLSAPKEDNRASEATRRVVQEEEERLILQKGPLQKKLAEIMSKCNLKSVGSDVERCLSMCVEERLRGLITQLIRVSKQRVDIEKTGHRFVVTSDVRRQISLINRKAKEEWDKKQSEEAEKIRKQNETESNSGANPEKDKDENRSKNVKVNKEEDDKMRTTAANVAARAAVGGDDMLSKWQLMAEQARQKREGLDSASASKTGLRKPSSNLGRSSRESEEAEKKNLSAVPGSGGVRRMGRSSFQSPQLKVPRSISIKDMISVLEREPQMSKSPLIYRLYERMPGDSSAE
ncbi:transcription initiation factor TFIID subunit 4b isoform X2 [Ananas comosus]|uniref:Transcription initiation factor TFIID subunit 4b isoform X2 n=1 Tax=Ananas comosus TaxID=4615 RepID=A0A6P5FIR3_ANACO|nr:transcription initiation factor TFIID subunit 4b isoform X2 [Ananas comosus]